MPALCLMFSSTYYAQNYAGIIYLGLHSGDIHVYVLIQLSLIAVEISFGLRKLRGEVALPWDIPPLYEPLTIMIMIRPNYNGRSSDKSPNIFVHCPSTCSAVMTKWPGENTHVALMRQNQPSKKSDKR